nr:MAG TPA: DNA-directed RNA polymerase [Caudoviricetes sp.]
MAECIDKKAFKKSVEERYCKPCKADGKDHNGCWCRACWVDDMLDEVECFQPADVAPVGHGLWAPVNKIDPISGYRCSKCRRRVGFDLTPYCPNCGAKMDGGDNNAAD